MNESQQQTKNPAPDNDDVNRTVVGVPQQQIHDALAFYDDSADSPELNEMEAFDRLEAALDEGLKDAPPASAAPLDRSAMVTQPLPQRVEAEPPAAPRNQGGDDEETSIEDYMANLLQRVNGGAMSPAKNNAPPPLPKPTPKPAPQPRAEAPAATSETPAPDQREVKPPPESREGLSHMRELANMSARSAIDTHANRQLAAPLSSKALVCAASIAGSSWIALQTDSIYSLQFAASVAALGIAVLYCRQFFAVAKRISQPAAAQPRQSGPAA